MWIIARVYLCKPIQSKCFFHPMPERDNSYGNQLVPVSCSLPFGFCFVHHHRRCHYPCLYLTMYGKTCMHSVHCTHVRIFHTIKYIKSLNSRDISLKCVCVWNYKGFWLQNNTMHAIQAINQQKKTLSGGNENKTWNIAENLFCVAFLR